MIDTLPPDDAPLTADERAHLRAIDGAGSRSDTMRLIVEVERLRADAALTVAARLCAEVERDTLRIEVERLKHVEIERATCCDDNERKVASLETQHDALVRDNEALK
jgi:hypothetical protein